MEPLAISSVHLDQLEPEAFDRVLGAMIAHYDRGFATEVEAVMEKWADQTEQWEGDRSINPLGGRSAAEYRRLRAAILEHLEHIAARG